LLKINESTSDDKLYPTVKKASDVNFTAKQRITGFITENNKGYYLYISLSVLERMLGSKTNANLFIESMVRLRGIVHGSGGKTTVQQIIKVRKRDFRTRFLKIDLTVFDAEVEPYLD